jgi:hypothetical protein
MMMEFARGSAAATGLRERPAPATRRWGPRLAWVAAGAAGITAWSALRASAHAPAGDPVCLLRQIAHIPCPTCGMTRALALLAAGEWRAALALHPWAPAVAIQIVAGWVLWGAALTRRVGRAERNVLDRLARWAGEFERRVPHLVALNAAVLLALWLLRLATGTLPPI